MSERLIIQPKSPWTEAEIGGIILSLILKDIIHYFSP